MLDSPAREAHRPRKRERHAPSRRRFSRSGRDGGAAARTLRVRSRRRGRITSGPGRRASTDARFDTGQHLYADLRSFRMPRRRGGNAGIEARRGVQLRKSGQCAQFLRGDARTRRPWGSGRELSYSKARAEPLVRRPHAAGRVLSSASDDRCRSPMDPGWRAAVTDSVAHRHNSGVARTFASETVA